MHEYAIGQALMDRIAAEAADRGAVAVHRVVLRIGEASGVEPDLLASAFEILKAHTSCESAALEIERVPPRWACGPCGRDIAAGDVLRCPGCGAPARLAAGDEILLARLEMEVP